MKLECLPYRPCVGAALFNYNGYVWVGKRALQIAIESDEFWQMPQGGIEDGETPEIAVLREIREETGLENIEIISEIKEWLYYDLPRNLVNKIWNGQYRGQRQKWFAVKFKGEDKDVCLTGQKKPEFSEWKWARLCELPDLVVPFKLEIYKTIVNQFNDIPNSLIEGDPVIKS